jgi:AcrR family transcriptional regulator
MTDDDSASQTTQERGPGRPREPEVDERILNAAFQIMAQTGYVRMSMDAVALEAGVTRPTIYRRYPSKMQLALAAIVAYCDQDVYVPTGVTRSDLIQEMRSFRRALDRPYGMSLVGTVLAEEHETPELLASFREYLVGPRRRAVQAILAQARDRGEFRPEADLDTAGAMLIGAYYAHYLGGQPFPANWVERVVDTLLAGLAAP